DGELHRLVLSSALVEALDFVAIARGEWLVAARGKALVGFLVAGISIRLGARPAELDQTRLARRSRGAGRPLYHSRGQSGEQLGRLARLVAVVVARAALVGPEARRAVLAALEVLERLDQVVLDHLELGEAVADLPQLVLEDLAHPGRRGAAAVGALELADEALDLGQREADRLELGDPVDAVHRVRPEQAEAARGPAHRLEEAQLLVEVDRPDRLADGLGQLADPEEPRFACGEVHDDRGDPRTHTYTLGSEVTRNMKELSHPVNSQPGERPPAPEPLEDRAPGSTGGRPKGEGRSPGRDRLAPAQGAPRRRRPGAGPGAPLGSLGSGPAGRRPSWRPRRPRWPGSRSP